MQNTIPHIDWKLKEVPDGFSEWTQIFTEINMISAKHVDLLLRQNTLDDALEIFKIDQTRIMPKWFSEWVHDIYASWGIDMIKKIQTLSASGNFAAIKALFYKQKYGLALSSTSI